MRQARAINGVLAVTVTAVIVLGCATLAGASVHAKPISDRAYARQLCSALAEVVETPPATTLERDASGFHLRRGIDHALRWHVGGHPYVQRLEAILSFDINGWVIWQRPLGRKPWRIRYDPVDPAHHEIEVEVRMWRWFGAGSAALAIAAAIVHARH